MKDRDMMPLPDGNKAQDTGHPAASLPAKGQLVLRSPGSKPGATADTAQFSAMVLLKGLRRRWMLALSLGLLCAGTAAAATWFLVPPPKHSARTLLYVPPIRPFLFHTQEALPRLEDHQRTQVAMIKSRLVLNSALREPKVAQLSVVTQEVEPIDWLEKEIKVDFSTAPEVLRIMMVGDRPEELTVLVDAIRKAYLREIIENEKNKRRERLSTLRELRTKYEEQLRTSRDTQKMIEEKAGGRNAGARTLLLSFVQQHLAAAERELLQTQSDLRKSRLELTVLQAREKKQAESALPDALVNAQTDEAPVIKQLLEKAQKVQERINHNLEVAQRGEEEPAVQQLRRNLQDINELLSAERKKIRTSAIQQLRERARVELAASISILQGRVTAQEENEKLLLSDVERVRTQVQDLTKNGIKLDSFRDDAVQVEEVAKRIANEEQALNIELEAPGTVKTLEEATVIRTRTMARRIGMTAGAGLAGLALVLVAVGWWEARARRIDSVEEVFSGLGLRIVGSLPHSARQVSRRLLGSGVSPDPHFQALLTESIDATRTQLLHQARMESIQVIMVTSAEAGEGKTSLASHLAASMARAGLKTLLIDGDLRNPMAHRLFAVANEVGLSEVLRGEAELTEVVRPTAVPGLSLIPAGEWDSEVSLPLAQGQMRALFAKLRQEFDFIVIDSSPVLPVADALAIGQSADAVIFSLLCQVSRMPNVSAATQRMSALGIRMLGVIVNGVQNGLPMTSYPYVTRTRSSTVTSE